jgi:hypothetical protein
MNTKTLLVTLIVQFLQFGATPINPSAEVPYATAKARAVELSHTAVDTIDEKEALGVLADLHLFGYIAVPSAKSRAVENEMAFLIERLDPELYAKRRLVTGWDDRDDEGELAWQG